NGNLDAEVAAGGFRQDHYYRLNVLRVEVPPLRNRIDDSPLLASALSRGIAARLGRSVPRIEGEVLAGLQSYSWPGNVRELRNVLERALILNPGDILASLDLLPPVAGPAAPAGASAGALNLREALSRKAKEANIEA